ncbi:hypothetical protein Tel_03590 [Candidatus Tenderia electrophaga]|jgi:hypothetical protein|uniref:Uncharacterized protein n=1 Tax=Candidatus Tenderia electrophaga TaxID=1748243 RepID=A0A0S2TAU7_9GAMM|nr:hypothetical protein Tel_03590 [Candidatus Tenderia electrophaga]
MRAPAGTEMNSSYPVYICPVYNHSYLSYPVSSSIAILNYRAPAPALASAASVNNTPNIVIMPIRSP